MRQIIIAAALCASVFTLSAATAGAAMSKDARGKFIDRCVKSMFYPKAQCSCMADIADKKLDDLSIAYLILDPNDHAKAAAMSKKMTGAELSAINHFMSSAPAQCKGAK
jgi:hypothetical protein